MQGQKWEIGCYGDGSLGHQHTREACARILRSCSIDCSGNREIETALEGEMSDDAWEENAALIILEANAPVDGATWGWRDGDFGLWPILCDHCEKPNDQAATSNYCSACAKAYQERIAKDPETRPIGTERKG